MLSLAPAISKILVRRHQFLNDIHWSILAKETFFRSFAENRPNSGLRYKFQIPSNYMPLHFKESEVEVSISSSVTNLLKLNVVLRLGLLYL